MNKPDPYYTSVSTWRPSVFVRFLAPMLVVVGGVALFFAFLLRRFPYDGLYGVDSYAYYYQARALWHETIGQAPDGFSLFGTNGLGHWPIGYHLHIIVGFLFGGEQVWGPRLVTLAMAALCPLLVYFIVGLCLGKVSWVARFVAGVVAAALLPLNATYTRIGLSLMSDIPSLCWALLAVYLCLRLWPPHSDQPVRSERTRQLMALGFGGALGIAVLTRYGTALLVMPIVVYLAVRLMTQRKAVVREMALVPLSIIGFLVVLLPQALYLATHNPGSGTGDFISSMSLTNIFSSGSTGPDGRAVFPQPMIVFYIANPLWDTDGGFLSWRFVPAMLLGLASLARRRSWSLIALLVTWWLLPALVYAATPYQAHRFALLYLPVFAILAGLGVGSSVQLLLEWREQRTTLRVWAGRGGVLVLAVLVALGSLQCWPSVRDWVATHAAWQREDEQVAALAQSVARGDPAQSGQPRAIAFGATASLYHYTQWPVLELFNSDQSEIQSFLADGAGDPIVVVVPENSLATQWANTPLGERWRWLNSTYHPSSQGKVGQYTVFRFEQP